MKIYKKAMPLRLLVLLLLGSILLGAALAVFYVNSYMYRRLRDGVVSSYEAAVTNDIGIYKNSADTMDTYFITYMSSDPSVLGLTSMADYLNYSVSKTQVRQLLKTNLQLYPFVQLFYCYLEEEDSIFSEDRLLYGERQSVYQYIRSDAYQETSAENTWHVLRNDGEAWLLRAWHHGSVEIGCGILLSDLFPSDELLENVSGSFLYFADAAGQVLTAERIEDGGEEVLDADELLPEPAGDFSAVSVPLNIAGVTLEARLYNGSILDDVTALYIVNILLILAVFVLVTALVFWLFNRFVYRPIDSMRSASARIAGGQLDVRLREDGPIGEVSDLNRGFNRMVSQLTTLKISLYEEKIRRQESQLAQLRLQLNPHLLLNSLNLIYSMTRQKHYETAQEFTMCMIRHFRYLLRSEHNLMPAAQEKKFLENYLRIVQLQYPDYFRWEIREGFSEEELSDILCPSLVVQNLAENTVKYGLLQERVLHLVITIEPAEAAGRGWVRLVVADDGPGFPAEELAYYNRLAVGGEEDTKEKEHIGIRNMIARVRLLYGGQARFSFENRDGAVVTLVFPRGITSEGGRE